MSQLDLIHQELKLDVKRAKYRKIFDFWLLHYLLIESYKEKHEDRLIKSHKEKHEEKTWRLFDFDKESWRENMIESHEENHEDCSIKLFTFI